MTDEMENPNPETINTSMDGVRSVQETIETFLEAASVDAVYGEPVEHGQTLIIPAAEVLSGLGFGMGSGGGAGTEDASEQKGTGYGSGGGGGGRVLSRPVAIIIADENGVRVEPVIDPTKIALAALTAAGFMMGMLARMLGKRSDS